MITAFMSDNELHGVYVIRREGLTKIRAGGFCGKEDDAGPGVYQVPEWAFDGRPTYGPPGGEITVCAKCSHTVVSLKHPR
jgi:hypothetical protein